MSALNAQYFAALSISSLASDDRSISIDGDGSYISHSAIYQQLSNIEDIATNFITRRPINLDFKHGVYSEVEYDSQQDFEFHVSTFSQHELISICIKCLPNFTVGEPVLLHPENDMKAGENHCALVFNIERKVGNRSVGERVPFKATLTNGEYTIILSNSSNVIPGTYLLSVCLADVSHYSNVQNKVCTDVHAVQAIRVHCKKTKTVRTIPLEAGVTVQGTANFSDMCYYRFVTGDPHHRITISVAPSANSAGDPDLYVTNQYNGQVGVTRENCVWSCVNLGVSRVDILPDDANLPENVTEGRIFVIGVASNGSEEADFLLTVTTSPPPLCTVFNFAPSTAPLDMAPPALPVKVNATGAESASGRRLLNCAERGCTLDLALVEGEYLHFAVQLPDTESLTSSPAASPSSIAVLVHDAPGLANIAHATVVQQVSVPALIASEQVNLHCGLGVHAGDTLAAQGLLSETPTHSNSNSNSSRNVSGLWPVVYASADVLFPDRESFTWRASSAQGKALMLLNPAEWKYSRPLCYFSLYGHSLGLGNGNEAHQSTASVAGAKRKKAVRLSLWRVDSQLQPALSKTLQLAQEIVSCVFESIDAQQLSLADRKYDSATTAASPHLRAQDDHNVTYFETEYASLVQLLHSAGAANGQVFYDLGCGAGRALLSAALSGIRFVRCVGVEALPSLASAAVQAVGVLTSNHHTGDVFRTPRAATPTQAQPATRQDQRIKSRLDHLNIPLPAMEVWLDNLLTADWSDADFVYTASLCFSDSLVHQLLACGARLRVGARMVTLKLTENYHQWFVLERTLQVTLACGSVPAYVLLRTAQAMPGAVGVE